MFCCFGRTHFLNAQNFALLRIQAIAAELTELGISKGCARESGVESDGQAARCSA